MAKQCNVAVVGAPGAVGQQLVEVLAARKFPLKELRRLAAERAVG